MKTVNIVFKSLYACPHRCGFCHVLATPRNSSLMSASEVKQAFDEIERRYAGRRVEIEMSGGEFTIRKDAVELVRYLRGRRIELGSLVLDTMGIPLADPALARELGSLFDKVNISVHSPDPETHARISGSRTKFDDLRAGIENAFRHFPAVFTNTSVNRVNWQKLVPLAEFVLGARRAARSDRPLFSLYYLPVYREYGGATRENERRLPDTDNADSIPEGRFLDEVGAEFLMARAFLAREGARALLRDFNMPACVHRRIARTYPGSSFGLASFTSDSLFVDFAHPIAEEAALESVYPSTQGRVKPEPCRTCVAEEVCRGLPAEWLRQGYEARPIDEADYEAHFPAEFLNHTLFGLLRDAVRLAEVVRSIEIDWDLLARAHVASLAGKETSAREARRRVTLVSEPERVDALLGLLERREEGWALLAARLREERARWTPVEAL